MQTFNTTNLLQETATSINMFEMGLKVHFNLKHWSEEDGQGFVLGNVEQLGAAATNAAKRLAAIYPLLSLDPFDQSQTRYRGYACGILFDVNDKLTVHLSNSLSHNQSDNPEFKNIDRKLPAIPMRDTVEDALLSYVAAMHCLCKPKNYQGENGMKWKSHLIRLCPNAMSPAKPTPPIPHKDNAQWVVATMLARANVKGGLNTIYDNKKRAIASFELGQNDFFGVVDRDFYHHLDEVTVVDINKVGYRDVLVLEFTPLKPMY